MDLQVSDFWAGLGIGLVVGLLVGWLWEDAWEMAKTGIQKNSDRRRHKERAPMTFWDRMKALDKMGVALAIVSMTLVGIGIFQVVNYTRLASFQECQAQYNQANALVRDGRLAVQEAENNSLYRFLESIEPLTDEVNTPREQIRFAVSLQRAIDKHEQRLNYQNDNPYEQPADVCGEY